MRRANQFPQGGEWYVLGGCTLMGLGIGMTLSAAGAGIIIGAGAGLLAMVFTSVILNG